MLANWRWSRRIYEDRDYHDEPDLPLSDYGLGGGYLSSSDEKYLESPPSDHGDVRMGALRFAAMRVERPSPAAEAAAAVDEMLRCCAMGVEPPSRSAKMAWLYDPRVRRITDPDAQPTRDPRLQQTMTAEVVINGVKAYTLFDTGCTTDSISPEMAYVATVDRVDLEQPMGLQLGMRGVHTSINYGARPHMQAGPVDCVHYMDVVNIDRYDVILGTTFCNKHKVILDFDKHTITIDGHSMPAYTPEQDAQVLAQLKGYRAGHLQRRLQAARPRDPRGGAA